MDKRESRCVLDARQSEKWRLLAIGAYRFAPPDNTSNFSTDVSATLPNALNHHVYLPRTLAGIHVRVLEKRELWTCLPTS